MFDQVPRAPPGDRQTQVHQKLKKGWSNAIIAVVDNGIVSYLRMADSAFGLVPLHRQMGGGGNKRKGKVRNVERRKGGNR